jgi:AcrR family transcriptional regulator
MKRLVCSIGHMMRRIGTNDQRAAAAETLFGALLARSGSEQLPPTALRILEAAVHVLGRRGLTDLSVESICKVAGISRATLYRYFGNKDDLLDAVGEFICRGFEAGLAAAAVEEAEAPSRFATVMRFLDSYTSERALIRIFEADPSFHLVFFRSQFPRHQAAVRTALDPVFDWIEAIDGVVVDRAASAQRLVRLQMSRLLIPFDAALSAAWDRAISEPAATLRHWVLAHPATPPTPGTPAA